MRTLNKIILKTAVEGLVCTIIAFCYGMGVFAMAFPGQMAIFYDRVGDRTLAAMYHSRVYDRHGAPNQLYAALVKNILADNTCQTIKYGNKFFAPEFTTEREAIITAADAQLIEQATAQFPTAAASRELLIAKSCNMDDFLRSGYIAALLKVGCRDTAAQILRDAIATLDLNRPCYAIFKFSVTDARHANDDLAVLWFYYYYEMEKERNRKNDAGTLTANEEIKFVYFFNHAGEWFHDHFEE